MDSQMMRVNEWVKRLAVSCGIVSNEMTNTMPTKRKQPTMLRAINIISRYSNSLTRMPCEAANSRSKAMAIIGRMYRAKKRVVSKATMPKKRRSGTAMVKIFPKR